MSNIDVISQIWYNIWDMRSYLNSNNPNWKGGLPKCNICLQPTSWYGIKRCKKCSDKILTERRRENRKLEKSTREGYILVWEPKHPHASQKAGSNKGYYQQHRLVMEKFLGRYLLPTEVVHHKNHVKYDNRIENLQLIESNEEHISLEQKGRKKSVETKARMSEAQKGNKHWLGKTHSEETKRKMSDSRKRYWESKK